MRKDKIQELGDFCLNLRMPCKTNSVMEHWSIKKVTHFFLVAERSIGKKLETWVSYFLKLRLQRSKPEYFTSVFTIELGQVLLKNQIIRLIVFDDEREAIVQWIPD